MKSSVKKFLSEAYADLKKYAVPHAAALAASALTVVNTDLTHVETWAVAAFPQVAAAVVNWARHAEPTVSAK